MRRRLPSLIAVCVVAWLLLRLIAVPQSVTATQRSGRQSEGQRLFLLYCASCHGVGAKGNGPVAPSLKVAPADLTRIKKEDGQFPADRLQAVIAGEKVMPTHGVREMPVWGQVLTKAQINSLVRYLESIQAPL